MPRDYRETVRALRAKAADPAVEDHERRALLAKADEMERRHDTKPKPTFTVGQPTITDRSGHTATPFWMYNRNPPPPTETPEQRAARYAEAWRQTQNLFANQHMWNRPPDEEHEDEDYGYEVFNDHSAYHEREEDAES